MNSAVSKTAVNDALATGEYLPIFQSYMAGIQKRASEGESQTYQTGAEVAEILLDISKTENPP